LAVLCQTVDTLLTMHYPLKLFKLICITAIIHKLHVGATITSEISVVHTSACVLLFGCKIFPVVRGIKQEMSEIHRKTCSTL